MHLPAARHLETLGRHLARAHRAPAELRPDGEVAIALSLARLGLGDFGVRRARDPDLIDTLLARLQVEHGTEATDQFRLWFTFEVLWIASGSPLVDAGVTQDLAAELRGVVAVLSLHRAHDTLDPLYARVSADVVRDVLVAFEREARRALGLETDLRRGPVPGLPGVDHPRAYRLAEHLGQLAADHLRVGDPVARARLALELEPALAAIGVAPLLPAPIVARLGEPEQLDADTVWTWVRWWLRDVVAGRADHLFEASRCAAVVLGADRDGLLVRKCAGLLREAVRAIGRGRLADELDEALDLLIVPDPDPQHVPEPRLEPLAAAVARVLAYLDGVVPREGLDALASARVVTLVHRLQGFTPPVGPIDEARVERFLDQFPGELRWVGDGLVSALEVVDAAHLARSVGFLVDSHGLRSAPDAGRCWIPGLRHRAGFITPDDLDLTTRPLWDVAAGNTRTLICPFDLCLTGHDLEAWVEGLDDRERAALADRVLVLVFARASFSGLDRVRAALERHGITHRLLVGREHALLNSQGFRELDEGTLEDDHHALTSPETQLSAPLFSAHSPWWGAHAWADARALCREIGRAVLADTAVRLGWSDAVLEAACLGHRNLQGCLVLGHRMPRSTLPLLWAEGTFRGRRWVPLVPLAPAEWAP